MIMIHDFSQNPTNYSFQIIFLELDSYKSLFSFGLVKPILLGVKQQWFFPEWDLSHGEDYYIETPGFMS